MMTGDALWEQSEMQCMGPQDLQDDTSIFVDGMGQTQGYSNCETIGHGFHEPPSGKFLGMVIGFGSQYRITRFWLVVSNKYIYFFK